MSGKMVAPAAARYRLRMWILLSGVSRVHKHQRTLLFEAAVGRALNQVRRDAVGDACRGAHAARDHDHAIGR